MIDYEKLKRIYYLMKYTDYGFIYTANYPASEDELHEIFRLIHPIEGEFLFSCIEDAIHILEKHRKNQELTQDKPKPKYEVGQSVWTFTFDSMNEWVIESIYWDAELNDFRVNLSRLDGGSRASLAAKQLYPSRQELIESQITYWCAQLDMKDEIQYWAKQPSEALSSCCSVHTGTTEECFDSQRHQEEIDLHRCQDKVEFIDGIPFSREGLGYKEEWQHRYDFSSSFRCVKCGHKSSLAECQHESDGKQYGAIEWGALATYKCKKCGEFYK